MHAIMSLIACKSTHFLCINIHLKETKYICRILDTPSNKFNDNKSAAGIIKGLKAIDKEQ